MKKYSICILIITFLLFTPVIVSAFSFEYVNQYNYNDYEEAGFVSGIWHGLIAPWSLLVRLLSVFSDDFDVGMYAYNNTGWFYDLGFLIGIIGSLPIGWLVAIIALMALFV